MIEDYVLLPTLEVIKATPGLVLGFISSMNYVVVPIMAAMLVLWWRRVGMLTWVAAWWLALYIWLQYGFATPIPQSVIQLYMAVATGALILYVTSDEKRFRAVRDPVVNFLTDRKYSTVVLFLLVLIPSFVAAGVYFRMTAPVQPPLSPRTVHPANPDQITVADQSYPLNVLNNPYRALEASDPDAFRQRVERGRETYYKNCFYCHGDNMTGNGLFAHGLHPIPTNFQDAGTIAQLTESFLFWRISKGAPGLPEEGAPWDSSMPAWEKFLTPDEMWEVILFLYDFTGHRPRALEGSH